MANSRRESINFKEWLQKTLPISIQIRKILPKILQQLKKTKKTWTLIPSLPNIFLIGFIIIKIRSYQILQPLKKTLTLSKLTVWLSAQTPKQFLKSIAVSTTILWWLMNTVVNGQAQHLECYHCGVKHHQLTMSISNGQRKKFLINCHLMSLSNHLNLHLNKKVRGWWHFLQSE